MWSLLLVALLLPLCHAAQRKVQIEASCGNCPTWRPARSDDQTLYIHTFLYVWTNKTTNLIEEVFQSSTKYTDRDWHSRCVDQPCTFFDEGGHFMKSRPQLTLNVLLFVAQDSNEKMDGIDNPIYYGYDSKNSPILKTTKVLPRDMKTYPFRLAKFEVTRFDKNGKKEEVLFTSGASKIDCNEVDTEAWIGNHGIYRLRKRSNGAPYFTNVYYWPRVGKILT